MFHMDRLALAMFLLLYTLLIVDGEENINEFKGPPRNLTLRWENEKMVIQSVWEPFGQELDHDCFDMVLQFRTRKTTEWQNKRSESCNISTFSIECPFSNVDLDAEKCYETQAQFRVLEFCLGDTNESQWSITMFMKNNSLYDVCPEVARNKQQTTMEIQRLVIILFSTLMSVLFLLIIFIGCFMKRVKKCVLPTIPDPKNTFYDLYDSHNGYLQEWMKASRNNNVHLEKIESVSEEQDEDQMSTLLKDNVAEILDSQCLSKEPMDTSMTMPAPLVQNVSDACFTNMNFTMNDSMYIML
ncbi:cytokine receptor-like factor 2 [Rana temporaria]|uniref:cytokine receptor-like factor 2 n=1 Tax=Rana temporaria TaxID=8407 RepID=UPI001AAD180C|nr:cytokine receptor-like factor 2 [Rana temporaria]